MGLHRAEGIVGSIMQLYRAIALCGCMLSAVLVESCADRAHHLLKNEVIEESMYRDLPTLGLVSLYIIAQGLKERKCNVIIYIVWVHQNQVDAASRAQ